MAELHGAISRLGIDAKTTVVVYSHQLIAAARAWWVLTFAGVPDVRILDGGFDEWQAQGFASEQTVAQPIATVFEPTPRTDLLTTTEDVLVAIASPGVRILDVRSADEFAGLVSGYDYLERCGCIPGSTYAGDAAEGSAIYQNPDGKLRNPSGVLSYWHDLGLAASAHPGSLDQEIIFYCGNGWRSSLAFFHAWLLGFTNIHNYSDGWCGWSTKYVPDLTATGRTPGWRQDATNNPMVIGAPELG